jgi:hypothetical protein
MASAELSRRVEKVVGYPPLSEIGDLQRREFHEALLEAASFRTCPGKWQAAILKAEQNRPKLRVLSSDSSRSRSTATGTCSQAPRTRRAGYWTRTAQNPLNQPKTLLED